MEQNQPESRTKKNLLLYENEDVELVPAFEKKGAYCSRRRRRRIDVDLQQVFYLKLSKFIYFPPFPNYVVYIQKDTGHAQYCSLTVIASQNSLHRRRGRIKLFFRSFVM